MSFKLMAMCVYRSILASLRAFRLRYKVTMYTRTLETIRVMNQLNMLKTILSKISIYFLNTILSTTWRSFVLNEGPDVGSLKKQ